ncbi:MAG: acyl transferase [Cyclobacteriaceae bacterium]
MGFTDTFKENITGINPENFESRCLEVFNYQFHECPPYTNYCNFLGKNPNNVKSLHQIPFLPIEFFKTHEVRSGKWKETKAFKSSGTTKTGRSVHFVKDLAFYKRLSKYTFEHSIGSLSGFQLLALLPSYQQRGNSSLIEMVDFFIQSSKSESGYFLESGEELLNQLNKKETKKLLIGVSYALLDLAENHPQPLENILIMETGGMKGRRKELTREDLHKRLRDAFEVESVYSEYGMTELMSQAYGKNGAFEFPKWARVLIRDINDPFCYLKDNHTGGINVIDLANLDSCSFIETKDVGRTSKSAFEVLGRFDNSDVRGCNLLIQRNI